MIYPWFDYCQRQATAMVEQFRPYDGGGWMRYLQLGSELWGHNAACNELAAIDLREALADPKLEHRIIESDPFVSVSLYRRPKSSKQTLFVILPHSGYAASALQTFIDGLLDLGQVIVTEWRDPRLVPRDLGGFGLLDQVAVIERALQRIDNPVTLIGLSQSGWPALIAADRQAASIDKIAILGAPIDPTSNPTPIQDFFNLTPLTTIEQMFTSTVPGRFEGGGRIVFPALLQLWTQAGTNPLNYLNAQNGLVDGVLSGKPATKHAEMHRLCDVPGELFVDMVALLRQAPRAILDDFAHGFDPNRLRDKPLLTVEAGADHLVGAGQTHAAADLLRSETAFRSDIRGCDHIDLFVGPEFVTRLLADIKRLIAHSDRSR